MTQDSMRERLARALFEKISLPMHGKDWGAVHSETRDYCRDAADAVLAVLAEPTEAMIETGRMFRNNKAPTAAVYRAMIGAAR